MPNTSFHEHTPSKTAVCKHNTPVLTAGNLSGNISVRPEFSKTDYNRYRPGEEIPTTFGGIVNACRGTYIKCGIVRNVVDLMVDLITENVNIVDVDDEVKEFYINWAKQVDLNSVCQEFSKHAILDANLVVKEQTGTYSIKVGNKEKNVRLPAGFNFVNVCALEWDYTDEDKMNGKKQLFFNAGRSGKKNIPGIEDVKDIGEESRGRVKLDLDKLYIVHYKKDSWEDWAVPYIYSILSDVVYKEKLRMAEVAALDGVINVTRIWKLGDHTNNILPSQKAVETLEEILQANTGGGAMDIIWDSMIELDEHYPPIDKILGGDKYTQVNRDILVGLGVPEVLLGGQGANFSNSWIQLKTLIERLQSIRQLLEAWLQSVVDKIQKTMGFKSKPTIKFSRLDIDDQNTAKKLMLGLLDRGIISIEAVLEIYGEDPELEYLRIQKEKKEGITAISPFVKQGTTKTYETGRPPVTKDSDPSRSGPKGPRRSVSSLMFKSLKAISHFDEVIMPNLMEDIGVSDARCLTSDHRNTINLARAMFLAAVKEDTVSYDDVDVTLYDDKLYKYIVASITNYGKDVSLEHRKSMEAMSWVRYLTENS